MASALLRVELATGFAKKPISPLTITTHFAMTQMHQLPAQAQPVAKKFISALALPGEFAIVHQIPGAPPLQRRKSKKYKEPPKSLELRALQWCEYMQHSSVMAKLLEQNSFAIVGGIFTFFSCFLAWLFPIECFQNALIGLGFFWFGLNGAHGEEITFTPAFYVLVAVCALGNFFLWEEDPRKAKQRAEQESNKKK